MATQICAIEVTDDVDTGADTSCETTEANVVSPRESTDNSDECGRSVEEEIDDCTTAPPSPRARWADLAESDDELELPTGFWWNEKEHSFLPPSVDDDEEEFFGCQAAASSAAAASNAVSLEPAGAPGPKAWRPRSQRSWWNKHAAIEGGKGNQRWPRASAASSTGRSSHGPKVWAGSNAAWEGGWNAAAYPRQTTRRASGKGGKSGGKGDGKSRKFQCQFFVGIEEDSEFHVVKHVLGLHGQHVKAIAEKTGAKLRLRGRGSKFLEGPLQEESTDPLMLCISSPDGASHQEAMSMVHHHLEEVYEQYRLFCAAAGWPVPDLHVQWHEGPRPGAS
mmetsp:Transcript_15176/g.34593  ORF Transcript_15176/g.34593 Transcript_15176/m.34593 type:complete len:335 (-) Transcript_15176:123-1127(-)